MPERMENLKKAIADLEREIGSLEHVDDETRELLKEAETHIHEALKPEDIPHHTLLERFEGAERDYSAAHPETASMLGRGEPSGS